MDCGAVFVAWLLLGKSEQLDSTGDGGPLRGRPIGPWYPVSFGKVESLVVAGGVA